MALTKGSWKADEAVLTRINSTLVNNDILGTLTNDADKKLDKMFQVINDAEKMDNDWENFVYHFDKAHNSFTMNLKQKYPKLTANELKLCTFLRLNLSTKEIAQLMNISLRGVELSRYRLRKKLELPTETSLFEFFNSI